MFFAFSQEVDMVDDYRSEIRRNHRNVVLLCIASVLINVVFARMAQFLSQHSGMQLWFDTIGTILAAALGGYLPGIFVGLVTNFMKGFMDFASIYYSAMNVLIAATSALLANHGFLTKKWKIPFFILVMAFIGGVIGGILPSIVNSIPSAGFLHDLLWDLADKTISVLLVVTIVRAIPPATRETLRFNGWKQTPLTKNDLEEIKKTIQCRSVFLRSKIIFILAAALVTLAVTASTISFILYRNALLDEYSEFAREVTIAVSEVLDHEKIDEYISSKGKDQLYLEVMHKLEDIKTSSHTVKFIYIYKIEEDGGHVVFDLHSNNESDSIPGKLVKFDPAFEPYIPTLLEGGEIEPVISDSAFGELLSVYTPVKNSAGKTVSYIGADIPMSMIVGKELNFLTQMVFLFLGFVILIIAIVVWFVDYNVVFPINSMTMRTSEFAYSGNNALEENIEKIRRLDIHTGDEVENLYKAFTKMTEDTMGYVDKIVSSAEHIAQIHSTFGKVVSPQVRDFLLSDNPDLGGQDLDVTVMFCDIRGFTTLSEKLEPKEIVLLLNRYFTRLEKPIVENGGIINKYIGDAIMAVFGVPLKSETHAYDAWKAAQGMRAQLADLNEELKSEGQPEIRFGIGLCSGTVLAGNIGTSNRLEYTVIGDTVNTASRIESLCKTYKTDLLISEQTKSLLPDDVSLTFIAESEIRGKEKRIKLYS
jgi:class 3 adenylate cyclase